MSHARRFRVDQEVDEDSDQHCQWANLPSWYQGLGQNVFLQQGVRHIVSFGICGKIRYYHLNGRGLVQSDPLSPDLLSLYYCSPWGRQLLRNFQNVVQGSRKTSGRAMWSWRQVTTVKSTPSLVCTALISMETRSVVPHFDPDVSPLAAIRPQPVGSRSTTCIAAKLLRLCTVHMIDLYWVLHNSTAVVVITLIEFT